jgi:two-component system response regulator YesN
MKILLIDDEDIVLKGLTLLISSASDINFEIYTTKSAIEALSLVEKYEFDVIVTDIRMPVMDGLTLCEKLRYKGCQAKIIIISGYEDFSYAKKAIKIGVVDYLLKPIDQDNFLSVIRSVISQIDIDKQRTNIAQQENDIIKETFLTDLVRSLVLDLSSFDWNSCSKHIDNFFNAIIASHWSEDSVLQFCIKLINSIAFDLYKDNSEEVIAEAIDYLKDYKTIEQLKDNFTNIMNKWFKILSVNQKHDEGPIISKIKDFIAHNYANVTLEIVADKMNFNPVYLSSYFKEKTGQNFKDYLTDIRIQEAKDLLKNPKLKIYEVADMVGYTDPKYFSKLFKKITGLEPTIYREIYSE